MQDLKDQQAEHYNKSAKDLPSLKTGNAVYVQLVPGARNWAKGVIIQVISDRTYKVKTKVGGIYVRNRKLIKIRHTDSKGSLKTVPGPFKDIPDSGPSARPKRTIRKPQRLIESINLIRAQDRRRGFI